MSNFLPYGKQWINADDVKAVVKILKSDYLTQGPKIEDFEKKICDFTGAKYCVAVANGTAALHLAVLALEIKKGKEGITSPNTFAASANCLVYSGLKPIFADINPRTYNISLGEIKKRITKNTKVIVAIDFAGQPADLINIYHFAKSKNIRIVEDACHAIGSKYEDGSYIGSCKYSDITTFSFHPVKTITTGEGGAITTNNKKIYQKLKILRTHGITKDPLLLTQNPGPWYQEMQYLGFNYRITDFQAALGISQLNKINRFIKRRREIVKRYNNAFKNIPYLTIPFEKKKVYSAFHLYILQIDFNKINKSRKQVMNYLKEKNIGTQVHYVPVHLHPYYQKNFKYNKGDFPITEDYYKKTLSLPLYPKMKNKDVDNVIKNILRVINY